MNKTLIIAALLIAAGAGVYFFTQGGDVSDVVDSAVETTTDAAASVGDAATTAATEAADAAKAATDAAAKAAEEAAAKVAEEAAAAAKATEEAAAKVAEDAAAAAKAAEEAAAKVAEDAAAAAADTAEAAQAAVTETAEAVVAEPASMMDTLLNADNFDAAKVSEMVEGSSLGMAQKTMLKAAIEKAGDNPEMIKAVIDQIKSALGQ